MDAPPLLSLVAAGDAAATRACIARYGPLVWALARRSCESRAEAEDAVQEILIEVWKSAARYDAAMGSEASFVAMIARRRLIDRRRRRTRRVDREELPEVLVDPRAGDLAEIGTEAALAAKAIEGLPPAQRSAMRLATYEGLSHEEIARSLGSPLGTVKANLRRGLAKIRRLLGSAPSVEDDGESEE